MSDTGTTTSPSLASIYRENERCTEVYLDMSVDTSDPPSVRDERRKSVLDRLTRAGSPQSDLDAVVDVLATADYGSSPVCLFLLVRNGEILIEEVLPGIAQQSEIVSYGPLPDVTPILKAQPLDFTYLTVETSRDGGEVRLFRAGSRLPETESHVQGRTDTLHKVKGGGWRHDHMQNHAEEIWRQTQAQLAGRIDEIVRTRGPRLLVVAGDIRARQLVENELSEASRAILAVEPTNTRAGGSTDEALTERVNAEIERILHDDKQAILDLLALHEGRGDKLVELGMGAVVAALAAGQAATVILDSDRLSERTALALDAEPWIATAPEEALGAGILGSVPAQLALCRAALLTDARVLFTDSFTVDDGDADADADPDADPNTDAADITLPNDAPAAAVLRWRTGPPVPGV
ncbi:MULTISPECIES: baeRF2 domain-containing protein [unclassified Leifsonia]|uniref:baeRF2 domain-containing protein n=1 Tax=unclassified Leifsonia TaxID=2663824 RepID=UPI0006FA7207|nr:MULTISPECIES: Vms1/Ankzf1 family peptidyl-tRNA hydrolase [unclassified Leifsonia]KQX07642.1 hypothetical protein ASC59_07885 [Leifsonia sp. Root1293]KRA11924.1 hypothetical protein ASD61_07885 [Leifsonia sp. Root60]